VGEAGPDCEQLTLRYGPMVLRRCRRLLGNEDEAMDACQDVFVRLVERQTRLDVRFPSSLLYTMATHVCLNRIRDRGRRPPGGGDDLLDRIAAVEEPSFSLDARLVLDRLFRRHPVSTRTIAVLHYLDGLTLEQVGEHVGLSVSGVRKRLRGLRRSLKEMENR